MSMFESLQAYIESWVRQGYKSVNVCGEWFLHPGGWPGYLCRGKCGQNLREVGNSGYIDDHDESVGFGFWC